MSDVDGVELDEKGAIKGAADLKKSIKSEWADFITTTQTRGAAPANPPANSGGTRTRADIYKKDDRGRYVMSTAERQATLAESFANMQIPSFTAFQTKIQSSRGLKPRLLIIYGLIQSVAHHQAALFGVEAAQAQRFIYFDAGSREELQQLFL